MSGALGGRLATLARVTRFTRLSCLLRNRLTEQGVEVDRRNHQRREAAFDHQVIDCLSGVGEQNSGCDRRE